MCGEAVGCDWIRHGAECSGLGERRVREVGGGAKARWRGGDGQAPPFPARVTSSRRRSAACSRNRSTVPSFSSTWSERSLFRRRIHLGLHHPPGLTGSQSPPFLQASQALEAGASTRTISSTVSSSPASKRRGTSSTTRGSPDPPLLLQPDVPQGGDAGVGGSPPAAAGRRDPGRPGPSAPPGPASRPLQHLRPEGLHHLLETGGSGLHRLPGQLIRVQHQALPASAHIRATVLFPEATFPVSPTRQGRGVIAAPAPQRGGGPPLPPSALRYPQLRGPPPGPPAPSVQQRKPNQDHCGYGSPRPPGIRSRNESHPSAARPTPTRVRPRGSTPGTSQRRKGE